MNGEEEELRGNQLWTDRFCPCTSWWSPPPKEGLTDYLSLPFQMHLGICECYLPLDNVSPQLILVLVRVREPQMEPESTGRIFFGGSISLSYFPATLPCVTNSDRSLVYSILSFDLFVNGSSELP